MSFIKKISLLILLFAFEKAMAQRQDLSLNEGWVSTMSETDSAAYNGFEKTTYTTKSWKAVSVPHNWDDYYGYRRKLHGNLHGTAWYRRSFQLVKKEIGKRYFLFFEGVSSYATIWLNGKQVGYHAGGRTSFTIDITDVILGNNQPNVLAVKAAHPSFIKNLPWVCGGCSDERGFSEGSQPMGIFRPVHLITTNNVRIQPFGVHAWNDTTVTDESATIYLESTLKNYSTTVQNLSVENQLVNQQGQIIAKQKSTLKLQAGQVSEVKQTFSEIKNIRLWSLKNPYLYTIETSVFQNGKLLDKQKTPYGIRWISWPILKPKSSNQFYLNGKPVFINGQAEYEHMLGGSHAFTPEQIRARISQTKATGFNAFRDAHQPHNLLYQQLIDSVGMLWWTQFSAHVWYDSPQFREEFKKLLKDWVIERRNSPSLVLWGLQNESKLPRDFAEECSRIIRDLDPTASSQRLITTCNGGSGTDWDVPQNWTGTYGGDPAKYGDDVKRQILIGEYGAWRTLGLHTEGPFVANGPLSEDRMTQLMEQKIRLAESVRDSSCGQFHWLLTSHDNPGRVQGGEAYRELDRIGPVNYKGLITPWDEPTDAFYMFRSNYAPKETEPMVYIVSHTWPDRWTTPGIKDSIIVYSNCDEVELFDGAKLPADVEFTKHGDGKSLGIRKRGVLGTHFQWDSVNIQFNVLRAVGYVDGKKVAEDLIMLNHLPEAEQISWIKLDANSVGGFLNRNLEKAKIDKGFSSNVILRINCGGNSYTDETGNLWQADVTWDSVPNHWGSLSWTNKFAGMPPYFASQRTISDPVNQTQDWPLYQSFRYGRQDLKYRIPVPNGKYLVELYFAEPWWGTGGVNATGYRIFDVAINDKPVIKNLDIYKEVGCRTALKKIVEAEVKNGVLMISFPNVKAGQALISAIAVFSDNKNVKPIQPSKSVITSNKNLIVKTWLNTGDTCFTNSITTFSALPSELYGADWLQFDSARQASGEILFKLQKDADIFIAIDERAELAKWVLGKDSLVLSNISRLNSGDKNKFGNTEGAIRQMKPFEKTISQIETSSSKVKYNLFKKRLSKDDFLIDLGYTNSPKELSSYFVFAQPASSLEPPYDLKTTTSYRPATAVLANAVKDSVNGRESINLTAANSSIVWPISTGVADIYSLTIRYANNSGQKISGTITFMGADGTVYFTEKIEFTPSPKGKWNYITTNTGSQINAGNYKVRITGNTGVSISGLDVQ